MSYGVCPQCSGPMGNGSVMCRKCRYPNPRAGAPNTDSGQQKAVYGVIVSFENADRKTLVLHRVGVTTKALRHACDDALRLDPTFRVVSVSTPTSIYTDMQGARMQGKQKSAHVGTNDHTNTPESQMLGRAGLAEMLHPRLAA